MPETALRRRFPLGIVVALVAVLALAATIAVLWPGIRRSIVNRTLAELKRATHARISYRTLSTDIFHQVRVSDLNVVLASNDSLLCRQLAVNYDLLQLIRGQLILQDVTLDGAKVFIADSHPPAGPPARRPTLTLDAVHVNDGSVYLHGRAWIDSIALASRLALDSQTASLDVTAGSLFLPDPGAAITRLTGAFALQESVARVSRLTIQTGSSRALLDAQANLNDSLVEVDLQRADVDLRDLALLPMLRQMALTGRAHAEGNLAFQLNGLASSVTGDLQLSARQFKWRDIALDTLNGRFQIRGSDVSFAVDLDDARLGALTAEGDVDLLSFDYAVHSTIERLNLIALPLVKLPDPLPRGTVTGRLDISGWKLDRAAGSFDLALTGLTFDRLTGSGSYDRAGVASIQIEAQRSPGAVTQSLRASATMSRGELAAHLELDRLGSDVLDSLSPVLGARPGIMTEISGKVDLSGTPDQMSASGQLTVGPMSGRDFGFRSARTTFTMSDVARLKGDLDLIVQEPEAANTRFSQLHLALKQDRFSVEAVKDTDLTMHAAGEWSFQDRGVRLTCDSFLVSTRLTQLAARHPFDIVAGPSGLAFTGFESDFAGGVLTAEYRSSPGVPPEFAVEVTNLDLHQFGYLFKLDSLQGRVNLLVTTEDAAVGDTAQLAAPGRHYRVDLSARDVAYGSVRFDLQEISGRMLVNMQEVYVDNLRLVHGTDTSHVTGSVAFNTTGRLQLGLINLRAVVVNPGVWPLAFLKGTVDFEAGAIYGDVSLSGTLDKLMMTGPLRLFDGQLYIPAISQRVTDVNAQFMLDRTRIAIAKASGRAGDGDITASGHIDLDGFRAVNDLVLEIHTTKAALHPLPDIVAVASGDINLQWADRKPVSVSGNVEIDEALITVEFGSQLTTSPSPGRPDSLLLDLNVKADRNVWLRNALMDLELSADVTIKKTMTGVLLSGALTTRQGHVYAFDHAFAVTSGVIRFDNPSIIDPTLDITARLPTRIRDAASGKTTSILIVVTGTAAKPVLALSSDPPGMNQTDIAYYLATNILPEEMSTSQNRDILSHLVSERLLGYLSRAVSTRLQKYIGVDVLELQPPTTTGGGLRVTVSKYVGNNLFLSYTANTTKLEPDAFRAEYFFTPDRELIGAREEDGLYNLRFQFKFRY